MSPDVKPGTIVRLDRDVWTPVGTLPTGTLVVYRGRGERGLIEADALYGPAQGGVTNRGWTLFITAMFSLPSVDELMTAYRAMPDRAPNLRDFYPDRDAYEKAHAVWASTCDALLAQANRTRWAELHPEEET